MPVFSKTGDGGKDGRCTCGIVDRNECYVYVFSRKYYLTASSIHGETETLTLALVTHRKIFDHAISSVNISIM